MSGVPVWWKPSWAGYMVYTHHPDPPTHIARPVPEDEAREALVAAAVAFGSCEYVQRTEFEVKLLIAVGEYIDALTKGDA